MIQWEQQQENVYFEAAKQAHADFFRGISSGREWHEARENIEEWYMKEGALYYVATKPSYLASNFCTLGEEVEKESIIPS